jgi:YidC/Oxa1 family membrane protein insertase
MAGFSIGNAFEMTALPDGQGVRFFRSLPGSLSFEREIRFGETYALEVSDRFINETEQPLQMPRYGLRSGGMRPLSGVTSTYGVFALGVDSLSPAESVRRWGKVVNGWLKDTTAAEVRQPLAEKGKPAKPMDWVAIKNKYFVQSLRPLDLASENAVVYVTRDGLTQDAAEVSAALQFPEGVLAAGESFTREVVYYVGPQKYNELSALGYRQNEIMELGWKIIRFFAVGMLWGMTKLYGLFGNYGVAIMLLTLFIRTIFWPLTHKGTESMRRMQELSPLMKALNEKYKTDPQKRQQALMELYKEHKVNPLGGCLPMIVQIPVFIGLFYVLRTAIDLRFSSFLWIDDLSEPEGMLQGMLPFGLSLNVLPLLMAVTMFFQQKLTPMPSGGDEKQQQMHQMMMRFMPIMMLVMLYNFASGLALYWTTQNVLMIVQQALYRRRLAHRKAEAAALEAAKQVTMQKEPRKKGRK